MSDSTPRDFLQGKPEAIARRNLTEETCRKWGYWMGMDGDEPVQIANYRTRDGKPSGQKIRRANKKFSVRGELIGLYLSLIHI